MFEAAPIDPFSEREIAAKAGFSVDDYGKADSGPYQVVMPTYPAPKWLRRFNALGPALRECSTLCQLRGQPFRVMRWGQEGSGKAGSPCAPCARRFTARFARPVRGFGCCGTGYLEGYPDAHPIAEFKPGGQKLVFNNAGESRIVGRPNYVVSSNPFPRLYRPEKYSQRYLDAVTTAQKIAQASGNRMFVSDGRTPVAYVEPGATTVNQVSPEYFQELVAQSRGRSYLGQGA